MLANRSKPNGSKRLIDEDRDSLSDATDDAGQNECVAQQQNQICETSETTQSQRHSKSFKDRCKFKMNSCWHWFTTWILPCLADETESGQKDALAETRPTACRMTRSDDDDLCDESTTTTASNEIQMQHVPQNDVASTAATAPTTTQVSSACAKRCNREKSELIKSASIVSMSDVLSLYRATRNNQSIALDPPLWVRETEQLGFCKICFNDSHLALPCCGANMCGRCVNVWWLHSTSTQCPLCGKNWPYKEAV